MAVGPAAEFVADGTEAGKDGGALGLGHVQRLVGSVAEEVAGADGAGGGGAAEQVGVEEEGEALGGVEAAVVGVADDLVGGEAEQRSLAVVIGAEAVAEGAAGAGVLEHEGVEAQALAAVRVRGQAAEVDDGGQGMEGLAAEPVGVVLDGVKAKDVVVHRARSFRRTV